MSLLTRFRPLVDLSTALQLAFWPTLSRVWASPELLLRPAAVSRIFMFHVWSAFGPGVDENNTQLKTDLITPNAHGVVLDVGAGYGHTAKYLDRTRVTRYVALEPNVLMHDEIRRTANPLGFTEAAGSLVLLPCGAEDTTTILTCLGGYQPVDTILSVLSLCSVPEPQETIRSLATEVLRPGGQLLFFEHVRNPLPHIAKWQTFWTPLWTLGFDGCRLDRPTSDLVRQVGEWSSVDVTAVDGDEGSLFWHHIGKFTKAT